MTDKQAKDFYDISFCLFLPCLIGGGCEENILVIPSLSPLNRQDETKGEI
jgi:hypothetical protein